MVVQNLATMFLEANLCLLEEEIRQFCALSDTEFRHDLPDEQSGD